MVLEIISSEQILFKGEVESVTLPGAKGSFTVLENHASLISTLDAGDRKSTRLNSSHPPESRMPSSA